MRHCIELRSGGRKRLRGVRGVHGSCCGATNGGCDGLGESLVETPGSAGCHEDEGRTPLKGPGLRFLRNGRPCCQRNRVSARLVYIEYSFLIRLLRAVKTGSSAERAVIAHFPSLSSSSR